MRIFPPTPQIGERPTISIDLDFELGPHEVRCYDANHNVIGVFDSRVGGPPPGTRYADVPPEGYIALMR